MKVTHHNGVTVTCLKKQCGAVINLSKLSLIEGGTASHADNGDVSFSLVQIFILDHVPVQDWERFIL